MNLSTILVGLAVVGAVAAIAVKSYRNKKAGKHSCSCGGSCGSCNACHSQSNKTLIQKSDSDLNALANEKE